MSSTVLGSVAKSFRWIARNVCFAAAVFVAAPTLAQQKLTPALQFETLKTLAGEWEVEESARLTIRFEATANGTVLIERWETQAGLHSMTVYHMDGPNLLATHYCPQGNQPRLTASEASDDGRIRFVFRDATDLDSTEGFQHDLQFDIAQDGPVLRSEQYRGPSGIAPRSTYTLRRAD